MHGETLKFVNTSKFKKQIHKRRYSHFACRCSTEYEARTRKSFR